MEVDKGIIKQELLPEVFVLLFPLPSQLEVLQASPGFDISISGGKDDIGNSINGSLLSS
ncbi:hypothetical protein KFK09_023070 [Dendrobium nobile]|uniref:Uncharacterized protein n=1 Tax=Dendrobium nobile TaxID=94219 RepID=A0A8T3AJL0_DENNO|nr:hypothetical protein KFK09_023070 [Dendrobium nobile]